MSVFLTIYNNPIYVLTEHK